MFFRLSNIERNEKPSSRFWIITRAQQTYRQTDRVNIMRIFCKFLCERSKNIALPSSKFCLSHTHPHIQDWHLQVHIMCVFQTLSFPLGEMILIYCTAYVSSPLIINQGTRRRELCSFTILPLCLGGLTSPQWVGSWVHPTVILSSSEKKQIYCPCWEPNLVSPLSSK
jgi:hypothetical protein